MFCLTHVFEHTVSVIGIVTAYLPLPKYTHKHFYTLQMLVQFAF